uniref:Uncharacterized protein n=1 Tax=Glossina palpalis gambiensis TaxID=67801 RepID=A0A1B0C3T3_9MUSC
FRIKLTCNRKQPIKQKYHEIHAKKDVKTKKVLFEIICNTICRRVKTELLTYMKSYIRWNTQWMPSVESPSLRMVWYGGTKVYCTTRKVYCTTRKYTVRPEKYSIRPEKYSIRPEKYTVRPEKYIVRPESILYDQKNEVRINHNLIKPYNVADIKPFVEQLFEEMNAVNFHFHNHRPWWHQLNEKYQQNREMFLSLAMDTMVTSFELLHFWIEKEQCAAAYRLIYMKILCMLKIEKHAHTPLSFQQNATLP